MARGNHRKLAVGMPLDITAKRLAAVALAAVLILSVTACGEDNGGPPPPGPPSLPEGTLTIAYSPEKEDLFLKLVLEFNLSRPADTPPVHAVRRDITDMLQEAVDGQFGAISPDSSIWLAQLDGMWQERNPGASLAGSSTCYALSPVVIAMWESTAFEMGYPDTPLGWEDLKKKALGYLFGVDDGGIENELDQGIIPEELKDGFEANGFALYQNATVTEKDDGWVITDVEESFIAKGENGKLNIYAVAKPEFKWSHPSVRTAAGLLAVTAECYAAAGKQADLTEGDLKVEAIRDIESTVERYGGESEDRVVMRILGEGGYPLDAFVAQEQMVIYFNRNTMGENLVAIYPKEGTFWMDHPLVLLEGPWVTDEQRLAFQSFAAFVTEREQQLLVLREGYRPGVTTVSLEEACSLIKPEYNVDPAEPETLLEVPSPDTMEGIWELWHQAKRRANIYLVADVSGSMQGEKIDQAKAALLSFVDQIESDQEQVALVQFSDAVRERVPLNTLAENRASLKKAIQQLSASGGTALYDATYEAFDKLRELGDVDRINIALVMTDGMNTAGQRGLSEINQIVEETDIPILIFCVGYGADADMDALGGIARATEARAYTADPETISKLYELLSAFF